jgi:hypothetical protein
VILTRPERWYRKCDNRMRQAFCRKMTKKANKRSVHAGPKQTRKLPGRRRAKLSSKHALEVASRRARVAELAASGKDLRECEELLKQEGFTHADHATLGRDLKQERDRLNQRFLVSWSRCRATVNSVDCASGNVLRLVSGVPRAMAVGTRQGVRIAMDSSRQRWAPQV